MKWKEKTSGNMGLTKVASQCLADTFMANQSLVFCINPESIRDAEKHADRNSAKRLATTYNMGFYSSWA